MLIGASWISIGELLIFYIGFFVLLLKFFCSKYVCKSQNLMNSQLSVNSEISNDLWIKITCFSGLIHFLSIISFRNQDQVLWKFLLRINYNLVNQCIYKIYTLKCHKPNLHFQESHFQELPYFKTAPVHSNLSLWKYNGIAQPFQK